MKKFISFLFAILLMFSLVSCGEQNDFVDLTNSNKKAKQTTEKEDNYYTINFETNSGTKINPIKIKENEYLNNIPETTRKDCIIENWYTDANFQNPIELPIRINSNLTLYAKWLMIFEIKSLKACIIDSWNNIDKATYIFKPELIQFDELLKKSYSTIEIKILFNVYYEQTFDAPLNIGYFGAPKFETYLKTTTGTLEFKEDIATTQSPKQYSLYYTGKITSIKDKPLSIEFSSNNIQNILYFDNITVTFQCS